MTPQTPPTDRPLTAGDFPLLREGDQLRIDTGGALHTYSHAKQSGKVIATDRGYYAPFRFTFVFRPASDGQIQWLGGERIGDLKDVALVTKVRAGLRAEAALNTAKARPATSAASEVDDLDLYDDKVQAGIAWTLRQVGEALGLTTWTQGDGSESVEGDVGAEIHTILVDAGLRDPETNEMAALASPPVSERERELEGALREVVNEVREIRFGYSNGPESEGFLTNKEIWSRARSVLIAQPQEPV